MFGCSSLACSCCFLRGRQMDAGRKDDGGLLTPGVYLYFVKTDKATYKGKITVGSNK